MDPRGLVLWLAIIFGTVRNVLPYTTSSAHSLYQALTYDYNNLVRPTGTTSVTVDFNVLSINYVDTKTQEMSVSGWFDVVWTDSRYVWTPSSYNNIAEMFMDYSKCWNPKLIVENSADDATILDNSALLFRVDNSGQVTWSPSGAFTVYCAMAITYYPFDVQTCYLSIKSWSYDSTTVLLTSSISEVKTSQYVENDYWEVTSTSVESETLTQGALTHSNLKFKFTLKRRSSALLIQLLLPLLMMSFMGMGVFLLPNESNTKIGFALGILLVEVLLMALLLEDTPTFARDTSLLGLYLLILIVLSLVEMSMTIVVVKVYHNKDRNKRVTGTVQRLTSFLSACTCFKIQDGGQKRSVSGAGSDEIDTIETPETILKGPPDFKASVKRTQSMKSVSPDCSFATTRTDEFRNANSRRRSAAWSDGGGLCGGGSDRKYGWDDIASAVDRFCFIIFIFLRLIFVIVFMSLLSLGAS